MASKPGASGSNAPISDTGSTLQRLLKKTRGGQIESEQHPAPTAGSSSATDDKSYPVEKDLRGSDSGSATGSSISDERQVPGDVFAEGGQSRFYEPIPEFEGRHRWDPRAEWTEDEEKRLIRKVSTYFPVLHFIRS